MCNRSGQNLSGSCVLPDLCFVSVIISSDPDLIPIGGAVCLLLVLLAQAVLISCTGNDFWGSRRKGLLVKVCCASVVFCYLITVINFI